MSSKSSRPRDISVVATPYSERALAEVLSNPLLDPERVLESPRVQYLHQYLTDQGCRSIVVEYPYVDQAYLDDYAQFFAQCFRSYERFCKRLHFFRLSRSSVQRRSFLDSRAGYSERLARLNRSYLGFVVARPLPETIIGRTVLRVYDCNAGRRFYCVHRPYTPNILGSSLVVQSVAFQEQDRAVAACATTALWAALHATALRFKHAIPSPGSITAMAGRYFTRGRSMPSEGLTVEQMCQAIKEVGLEPELKPVSHKMPFVSHVYAYLRAGVPVIVGGYLEDHGYHAVTLFGYRLEEAVANENGELFGQNTPGNPPMLCMKGLWVSEFYGHDDQVGPFARMPVEVVEPCSPLPSSQRLLSTRLKTSWPNVTGDGTWFWPTEIIIPVHGAIRLDFLEVVSWAYAFDRLVLLSSILPNQHLHRPLDWDVALVGVNEYRLDVRWSGTYRQAESRRLQVLHHPLYIWRARASHNREPVLEVLADATDVSHAEVFYAATHFGPQGLAFIQLLEGWLQSDPAISSLPRALGCEHVTSLLLDAPRAGD